MASILNSSHVPSHNLNQSVFNLRLQSKRQHNDGQSTNCRNTYRRFQSGGKSAGLITYMKKYLPHTHSMAIAQSMTGSYFSENKRIFIEWPEKVNSMDIRWGAKWSYSIYMLGRRWTERGDSNNGTIVRGINAQHYFRTCGEKRGNFLYRIWQYCRSHLDNAFWHGKY